MSEITKKNDPIDLKQVKWDELSALNLTALGKDKIRAFMLNQPPAKAWIKKHPVYKNSYLPIDKIEYLLTVFFVKWTVEVKQVFQIANSICVNVRLHYVCPEGKKHYQDGVGASPMQVNSGANAMDANAIKSNAVMLALPIAETNAVKDAADKIGKIFGRDLNRRDVLNYDVLLKNPETFDNASIIERNVQSEEK